MNKIQHVVFAIAEAKGVTATFYIKKVLPSPFLANLAMILNHTKKIYMKVSPGEALCLGEFSLLVVAAA